MWCSSSDMLSANARAVSKRLDYIHAVFEALCCISCVFVHQFSVLRLDFVSNLMMRLKNYAVDSSKQTCEGCFRLPRFVRVVAN
mmetsp:Transcript_15399/g.41338  ORF Transcript_15399/g.41338 Transcript_15399/m.41338 type:complete len:84 (+) Transcript_15399:1127-1378(+)